MSTKTSAEPSAKAASADPLSPPKAWHAPDGSVISCTEKVKVLNDNWKELRELLQDALDDAILMGCTQTQFKHECRRLIDALQSEFKERS